MVRELLTAEYVHGSTGIDGTDVFEPTTPAQRKDHAVDFIVDTLDGGGCRFDHPGTNRAHSLTSRWRW